MEPVSTPDYGRRLIASLVDDCAIETPQKTFAFVSRTSRVDDMQAISHYKFANAVNRCAFWMEELLGRGAHFDTVAYLGPSDLRTSIIILAAIKTGHKALLTSPRNSLKAHLNLLETTKCRTFMTVDSPSQIVTEIMSKISVRHIVVPKIEDWIDGEQVALYPYQKSFDEARNEPFVVVHTSGSTAGLPKPIVVTHGTVAASDAFNLKISNSRRPTVFEVFRNRTCFVSLPLYHIAGIDFVLSKPFFYGLVPVLPPNGPINTELVNAMHQLDIVEISILAPSIIEDITKTPAYVENLEGLHAVAYGGGPLSTEAGEVARLATKIYNLMGGLEMYCIATEVIDQEYWEYLSFSPMTGSEFRYHSGDLHELFFVRKPEYDLFQAIFATFPDLQEYHTNDLYSKHPTIPGLWRYSGRADDIITLSNGEKLNPITMEHLIESQQDVQAVLVTGQGRFRTALLVEARNPPATKTEKDKLLERIWPLVQQANDDCPAHGRISRDLIVFTSAAKPFQRSGKGTVQRRLTIELYQNELDDVYRLAEQGERSLFKSELVQRGGSLRTLLRNLVIKTTGWQFLDDDQDLFHLGMDSRQVVDLVAHLRLMFQEMGDSFGATTEVTASLVYNNPSVRRLTQAIQPSNSRVFTNETNGDFSLDRILTQAQKLLSKFTWDLPFTVRFPLPRYEPVHVVLTGSTGSLGSYLLDCLLNNPKVTKVYCLNRSSKAETRQIQALKSNGLSARWIPEKVKFLVADHSKQYLGLTPLNYRELLLNITHVMHNAWEVNFNLPVSHFEKPHLLGVRQWIEFSARSLKGAMIYFVSSVSAVMDWNLNHLGPVPERILEDFTIAKPIGYAQSKLIAENVLNLAGKTANIPSIICRVGQLAGPVQKKKGVWKAQEWLPSLIASSKYLRKIPDSLGSNDSIDWIPIDIVSQIIVEQMEKADNSQPSTSGDHKFGSTITNFHTKTAAPSFSTGDEYNDIKTAFEPPLVYNNVNTRPTSWKALIPTIQTHFRNLPLEVTTLRDWVEALAASASRTNDVGINPAIKLLDFFQELARAPSSAPLMFETENATRDSKVLADLGPVRPEWMALWLDQWGF